MLKRLVLFILLSVLVAPVWAQKLEWVSTEEQTLMIELFTSEGCSSCPPAERWLNQLRQQPDLWSRVIPLAFHVDYWNYLGWRDRFSRPEFSQRQRTYVAKGYARSVYTPGFFINGSEWRRWFRSDELPKQQKRSGKLQVRWDGQKLNARFEPVLPVANPGRWKLYAATLGFDFETKVGEGENEGKRLQHDFVVTDVSVFTSSNTTALWTNAYSLDLDPHIKALVFWVTRSGDPKPLQSVGGWIEIRGSSSQSR